MLFKSIFAGILLVFVSSISAKECNLDISGTDMMQFDKTILELDSGCTSANLTLKHTGHWQKILWVTTLSSSRQKSSIA